MRGRRTAFALLGALVALFVALPFASHDSASSPRVAISTHSITHVPSATRRSAPDVVAVLFVATALAALAMRRAHRATHRTPALARPIVVASRGPPR